VDEAHVEHAVSFIQYQNFYMGQVDLALTGQIEQATRAGNQDVDALGNGLHLRVHADAAEDARTDQRQVAGIQLEAVVHLGREFAGRGQYQDPWLTWAMALGFVRVTCREQTFENRQGETAGLTGTGLCGDHQVAALQHGGNCPLLHGGRLGIARGFNGADKSLGETEGSKGHGQSCSRVGWARRDVLPGATGIGKMRSRPVQLGFHCTSGKRRADARVRRCRSGCLLRGRASGREPGGKARV